MKTSHFKFVSIGICVMLIFTNCKKPYMNACFTYSPSNPDTSTPIIFNASCSENAELFIWNFGDGSKDTTRFIIDTIAHKYNAAGNYTITLNIENKHGGSRKSKYKYQQVVTVQ